MPHHQPDRDTRTFSSVVLYLNDFTKSTRVFLLIIKFITNPPNGMEDKLTREAPNYPVVHLDSTFDSAKAEEWFKKKLKNLTEERTPLAVAHRLSVLKSFDIGRLQHDVTIEIGLQFR
ncbi:hypothetical protein V1477_005711 [Vespula maculifrons]|uniref:Uncharacterized protein n=1 Tax=Vespula maculifrons TaxID=7453 RepID=A0ABD2CMY5_VESMC